MLPTVMQKCGLKDSEEISYWLILPMVAYQTSGEGVAGVGVMVADPTDICCIL
jgi:hypothetical protein